MIRRSKRFGVAAASAPAHSLNASADVGADTPRCQRRAAALRGTPGCANKEGSGSVYEQLTDMNIMWNCW